jgi:hypothetical protein
MNKSIKWYLLKAHHHHHNKEDIIKGVPPKVPKLVWLFEKKI